MSASIWNPQGTVQTNVNADGSLYTQSYTATAQQVLFTLTLFAYTPGTRSLLVEINGVSQLLTQDYLETDGTHITLTSGCEVGDQVVIRGFIGSTGAASAAVSAASAAASLAAIQALNIPNLPLTVDKGGTAAVTAAAARANLSAVGTADVIAIAQGGTGATTALAGFDALNSINGVALVSAANVNLDTATGKYVHITGNVAITSFTLGAGKERIVTFDGTATLTSNASILIPGSTSIVTAAGDVAVLRADSANIVKVVSYQGAPVGRGGTTGVASVTLTASSAAAQSLNSTSRGMGYNLPDSTTCVKSLGLFLLSNTGDFDEWIKDSTGVTRGFIRPRTSVLVGLADNSTAAGGWILNGSSMLAITAQFSALNTANLGAGSSSVIQRVALDANRTMLLYGDTDLYAVVWDASTTTMGTAVLVRAGIASITYRSILSAANQVMVVSCNTLTALQAVTLSVAGTVITVNAAVAVVLASNVTAGTIPQLIAVGTSWVVCYIRVGLVTGIRAITLAGTVPTIGAEAALATAVQAPTYIAVVDATHVLTVCLDATTVYAKPFSIAGSVLTAGTQATAVASSSSIAKFHALGSGRWAVIYNNTNVTGAIISVNTGTNTATLTIAVLNASTFNSATVWDTLLVGTTKVVVAFATVATTDTLSVNTLTDGAGTASAGVSITVPGGGVIDLVSQLAVSGNTCRFFWYKGTLAVQQGTFDCSGASPVLSRVDSVSIATAAKTISTPGQSSNYGDRAASAILSGNTVYSMPSPTAAEYFAFNTNSITIQSDVLPLPGTGSGGAIGAVTETWVPGLFGTGDFAISRVEVAIP